VGTIPAYRFPEAPARALGQASHYGRWLARRPGRHARPTGTDANAARAIVGRAQQRGLEWLPPDDALALLAAAGIRAARQRTARTSAAAAEAAAALGFPVALKLIAADVVHKSDVGGVVLGLEDADAVRAACERMLADVPARIEGFLVQEQARPGREVLVGVTADPTFGPLVGFGLGGTAVEALHDTAFRIAPLTDVDAAEMVRAIRGRALLEAFRGRPAADVGAIEDLLLRVSWLAETVHIEEMDLNPVIVYPRGEGALAIDVRVSLRPPDTAN
jgi:acetyltransferase